MTGAVGGPAVILGVGNVLLRDDGVGVRLVEALRALVAHDPYALPEGTRLVDGGTLGLDLLRTVADAGCLLVLDGVDLGEEAGTVTKLRGDAILAAGGARGRGVSSGVGELLAVARLMGWLPDPVAMVGVQVHDTSFGVGLSERVEAALPRALEAARDELRELREPPYAPGTQGAATRWAEGALA
jgi:hydrogenase maturation protease